MPKIPPSMTPKDSRNDFGAGQRSDSFYQKQGLLTPDEIRRLHEESPYARRVSLPQNEAEWPRILTREGYSQRDVSPSGDIRRSNANKDSKRDSREYGGRLSANFANEKDILRWQEF